MKDVNLVVCAEDDTKFHIWKKGERAPLCGAWIGMTGMREADEQKDEKIKTICIGCSCRLIFLLNTDFKKEDLQKIAEEIIGATEIASNTIEQSLKDVAGAKRILEKYFVHEASTQFVINEHPYLVLRGSDEAIRCLGRVLEKVNS